MTVRSRDDTTHLHPEFGSNEYLYRPPLMIPSEVLGSTCPGLGGEKVVEGLQVVEEGLQTFSSSLLRSQGPPY